MTMDRMAFPLPEQEYNTYAPQMERRAIAERAYRFLCDVAYHTNENKKQ